MKRFTKALAAIMLMTVVICAVGCKTINVSSGVMNSHEYVDLGLPSGTLWATCNIGANKPEEYGDYFAWGETEPKETYGWETYKFSNGDNHELTKYCDITTNGNNGFTDNLIVLQKEDDPATTKWGGGWRTPSKAQWDELLANTTNKRTTQKGMKGRLFTSKKNGKSIFLPAAGCRWYRNEVSYAGSMGKYWSRSLNTDDINDGMLRRTAYNAWFLFFNLDYSRSDDCSMHSNSRNDGFSVRPVYVN